jgi:protein tyrosine/serine phosphatase
MSALARVTRLGWALLLAAVLIGGSEIARIGLGSNLHTVLPGRCYRCAQPTTADLRVYARNLKIRTVINLRGFDERPWYYEERAAAQSLGMEVVDAGFWASSQPTREEFLVIARALDESPEPLLLHCDSGSDRSGLAAAIFLLLKTETSVDEASRQLSIRFGHLARGRAGCQDRILASYAAWLAEHGWQHQPGRFRRWAAEVYQPELLPAMP